MPTVSPDSRSASPPDVASPDDGDKSRRAMLTAEQQQKKKQVTPRYSIRESSRRGRGLDPWSLVSGGDVLGRPRSRKTLSGDHEAGHSWGVGARERRSILGGGYSTSGFPAAEHRSPFLSARSPSEGLSTWRFPMDQSSVNPFSASFGGERGSPTPGGGGNAGEGKIGGSVQPLLGRGSGGYGGNYGSRWEGTGGGVFWGGGGGTESKVSSSKKPRVFGHTVDDQGDAIVLFILCTGPCIEMYLGPKQCAYLCLSVVYII